MEIKVGQKWESKLGKSVVEIRQINDDRHGGTVIVRRPADDLQTEFSQRELFQFWVPVVELESTQRDEIIPGFALPHGRHHLDGQAIQASPTGTAPEHLRVYPRHAGRSPVFGAPYAKRVNSVTVGQRWKNKANGLTYRVLDIVKGAEPESPYMIRLSDPLDLVHLVVVPVLREEYDLIEDDKIKVGDHWHSLNDDAEHKVVKIDGDYIHTKMTKYDNAPVQWSRTRFLECCRINGGGLMEPTGSVFDRMAVEHAAGSAELSAAFDKHHEMVKNQQPRTAVGQVWKHGSGKTFVVARIDPDGRAWFSHFKGAEQTFLLGDWPHAFRLLKDENEVNEVPKVPRHMGDIERTHAEGLAFEMLTDLGYVFDGQCWSARGTVPSFTKAVPGYELLADVLDRAYHQAAVGKGAERHAEKAEAFDDQLMQDMARRFGVGSLLGQAFKKSHESQRLPVDRGVRELLGAIVYLAGAVIRRELDEAA